MVTLLESLSSVSVNMKSPKFLNCINIWQNHYISLESAITLFLEDEVLIQINNIIGAMQKESLCLLVIYALWHKGKEGWRTEKTYLYKVQPQRSKF